MARSTTTKPPKKRKPLQIEHVAPDTLKPAPYNPRTMSPEAAARLRRGIETFGLVDPVIARRSDRLVIGGHQRLVAATELQMERIPVVFIDDLDDDHAAALNILLNNPDAQGSWDMKLLSEILSELDAHGFDATLTAFDDLKIENILTWTPLPTIKGPGIDPRAEWQGMPEYEHEDLTAWRTIKVHLADEEALRSFAEAIGQNLTERTRSIWHPYLEAATPSQYAYVGDSDAKSEEPAGSSKRPPSEVE